MKQTLHLILVLALIFSGISANAQCVVDANNVQFGITPPDSVFPAIVKGQQLDNSYVAQLYLPTSITISIVTANIRWVKIDTITGLPAGVTYTINPDVDTVFGGERSCILLSGLTNANAGDYPLNFDGLIRVNVSLLSPNDTTLTIAQLNQLAQLGGPTAPRFGYKVKVVDPTGINEVNTMLAAAMQIAPNPNNGRFDIKFNYHGKIEGGLRVVDVTGKTVFTQPLDVDGFYTTQIDLSNFAKGVYSVQVKTASGVASKIVSVN